MAKGRNDLINSRIFHIANECYVFYLGIKTDEEKPFLRIGNMENIDQKILDEIDNTVIASYFTGNPLFELKIEKHGEINYIGDTAVIKRMKTYLNSFHLPTNGVVDYHNIKDGEQRDVVYFYNNGNIKLHYKDKSIFDLFKRSESDLHFVKQCDEIKKLFSRNPLRYKKHDFKDSGFVLSGGSVLVFSNSLFFSTTLRRDYFSQLAAAGIDPDQINVHYTRIKGGDEEKEPSYSFIEMLKRSSYRNCPFTVLSKYPVYAKKIGALFPGAQVVESGTTWSKLFNGLEVRDLEAGLEIKCGNFPHNLFISDTRSISENMVLNPAKGILLIKEGHNISEINVPDGILCTVKDTPPSIGEMTDIYISRFVPLIKGFSDEDEYRVAVAVQKLLKMLAPIVDGDDKSGLIMRSSVFNFTDLLRRLKLGNDSILTFVLNNVITILDISLSRTDMEGKIVKNINSIKHDIRGI